MKKARYIFCIAVFLAGCGAVELREDAPAQTVSEAPQAPAVQKQEQEPEPEAQAPAEPEDTSESIAEEVRQLIKLLGHEKYRIREKATVRLLYIGRPALEALEEAAGESDDLEVQDRAQKLIKLIREGVLRIRNRLARAVRGNNIGVVKEIVSLQLWDLRSDKACGPNLLRLASENGRVEVAAFLIKSGLKVGTKNEDGMTPLHFASSKEVAKVLVTSGADVNAKDAGSRTPLHHAAVRGAPALCEYLCLSGADVNAKDAANETPMDKARKRARNDVVKLLRKHGAESADDAVNLEYATMNGEIGNMKKYIARGADMNAKVWRGRTLLHWAALMGEKEVAKFLIENGASVSEKADASQTPLHFAAGEGCGEIVKLLLKAGADVNAKDLHGRTPLHEAAFWEKKETVELLLASGAQVNAKDVDGATPLDEVDVTGKGVLEALRKHGGESGDDSANLLYAARAGKVKSVKKYVARGADINTRDEGGRTALHWAAALDHTEIAGFLLSKGAKTDIKDEAERTALHEAALWGSVKTVDVLVKAGAEVNRMDVFGETPLDEAGGREKAIGELLRKHGAKTAEELTRKDK